MPKTESDGLELFHPAVSRWFREALGEPTLPQRRCWPSIAAAENTLICSPTGSGKTLAAFLAALDLLWREPAPSRGVRILYVSPLKALNQDVSRNLLGPLEGILEAARGIDRPLRPLRVGVRSGDTPPADRQRLVRCPPDILITTPESLHLMLTSRARETLRTVTHVIVDEIHAICGNKRGVFLALLLERLDALTPRGFVRIGLSATQRPLEEVARYLGGARRVMTADGGPGWESRPVRIIDAGQRKSLDLKVLSASRGQRTPRGGSVWPALEEQLLNLIESHRSTIVFANNRRIAERLASRLNALREEKRASAQPDASQDVAEAAPSIRAHHGSLSLEERRATEEALKRGELAAVVATASLELGIDMGAVDLVCQVESPGSVARGLQRVGRSGHVVGMASKGRIFAKTSSDLLESAALCRRMTQGSVESLRVPTNCLDILAQQVVACVAVDRWDASELYRLVRQAYPYRNLPIEAFESVLSMISGRFPLGSFRDLRARVVWDRLHHRLAALPGTARLALAGGGTIPDTGQYPVYLGEGGPRLGELDEEFVLERRAGETFVLGTNAWRIESIEPQKVMVAPAEGRAALLPFWRGEQAGRSAELGEEVGAVCREVAASLDDPHRFEEVAAGAFLEPEAARALRDHVARQLRVAGVAPDDRTILVEAFRDPAGETGLAILTPFGAKLHHALKLAAIGRLRDRLGLVPACLHTDDGLLIRLPQGGAPPLDLLDGLAADAAEALIRRELAESALFGLRFRQNAGRALLLPRPDPSKRTPLWLQRLRARDLLQVARKVPNFPVVVETFRECLEDDLELPRLRVLLDRIGAGEVRIVKRAAEVASPFTSELIFLFEHTFLYQWDEPAAEPAAGAGIDSALLDRLLTAGSPGGLLDPAALARVEARLRGHGRPPRSSEEAADRLRTLGDLTPSELDPATAAFLDALAAEGRVVRLTLDGTAEPARLVLAEEAPAYRRAFPDDGEPDAEALGAILRRYLDTRALVGLADLVGRYPIDPATATEWLERWEDEGQVVRVGSTDDDGPRWAEGQNLLEARRLSIALKRRETVAVAPEVYAAFLADWQGIGGDGNPAAEDGPTAVAESLERLQGFVAPAEVWESEILPTRVAGYRPAWLDAALESGEWAWRVDRDGGDGPRVGFLPRQGLAPVGVEPGDPSALSSDAVAVHDMLRGRGACFATDLARGTGREPSRVRAALEELWRGGWITNDRFDPLRPGATAVRESLAAAARRPSIGRPSRGGRRLAALPAEGRWSLLEPPPGGAEPPAPDLLDAWASTLLHRYGVLSRETAGLDRWAPPWRLLAERLARAELRGEVRRGYFVEGLSGAQYATEEAAAALSRMADRPSSGAPLLLHSLDPANPYGSGGPFDVDLMKDGTARLHRGGSNYIVLATGRPVLVVESGGRRLTTPGATGADVLRAALGTLPRLLKGTRRLLRVESFNGSPAIESPAAPWLAEVGFVRDYPAMTLYATW